MDSSSCSAGRSAIPRTSRALARHLQRFYEDPERFCQLAKVVRSESAGLSLRVLDFLVTNYCCEHRVEYAVARQGKTVWCNLHYAYRQQLQQYSKVLFDPFARRGKMMLRCGDDELQTTPGQMNFFRWAMQWGVLDYARRNLAAIRAALPRLRQRVSTEAKRRWKRAARPSTVHVRPLLVLSQPISSKAILLGHEVG